MKKITAIIAIFALSTLATFAQDKPQKVVSIVDEDHEKSWYETQAKLWKAELKKNPKNENGWLYYYTAKRMIQIKENWPEAGKKELENLLVEMQKAIPNTFIYNYAMSYHWGGFDHPKSGEYLAKAYAIDPDNPAIYDEFVVKYEINQDLSKRKEVNLKWFNSNTYSQGKLAYNYNVLSTLSKNAIFFTCGDNDTYPLWMIQDALNYRPDVTVINTSLIRIESYRQKIFQKFGIILSPEEEKNFGKTDTEEQTTAYLKKLLNTFITKAKDREIYFGLTCGNPDFSKDLESKMYIVGLASVYSEEEIDNLAILRSNFEKNYKLDYLNVQLYVEPAKTVVPLFDQNYVAPLLMLYTHYSKSSDVEKAERIKTILVKIAKENGMENKVLPLLK